MLTYQIQEFQTIIDLLGRINEQYQVLSVANEANGDFDFQLDNNHKKLALQLVTLFVENQSLPRTVLEDTAIEILSKHMRQDIRTYYQNLVQQVRSLQPLDAFREQIVNIAFLLSLSSTHMLSAVNGSLNYGGTINTALIRGYSHDAMLTALKGAKFLNEFMAKLVNGPWRQIDPYVFLNPGHRGVNVIEALNACQNEIKFSREDGKQMSILFVTQMEEDKEIFGPIAWDTLHFLSIIAERLNMVTSVTNFFLIDLQSFIPCHHCANHWAEICNEEITFYGSLDKTIQSIVVNGLAEWLHAMHNRVNSRKDNAAFDEYPLRKFKLEFQDKWDSLLDSVAESDAVQKAKRIKHQ
ncbi:hypothetical protein HDE_12933 [Halotydeus destructor]|nr:hypothetical protein HDE_12933 [Halotydeus destructor]